MSVLRLIGQALALACLVAVAAFALTGIGASRLDEARTRNALLGERASELRERFSGTPDNAAFTAVPETLLHPGDSAATATLALQQAVVGLASTHRLTLLTFGAAGAPYALTTQTIAVELEAQGEWSDAIRFLAGMETLTPRVAVSSLSMRAQGAASQPGGQAPVTLRVVAWGFHGSNAR